MAVVMLLAVNCDSILKPQRGSAACTVIDGEVSDEDSGLAPECNAEDSSSDAEVITRSAPQFQPGGTVIVNVAANTDPASATGRGTHTTCYEATQVTNVAASVLVTENQFDQFCTVGAGSAEMTIRYSLTKNGLALENVVDASARLDCGADSVETTGDYFDCTPGGVAGRHTCTGPGFHPDRAPVVPGDVLTATLEVEWSAELGFSGPIGDGNLEGESTVTYFLSGFGLVETPCPGPESCATNTDCDGEELCLDLECHDLSFGTEADATLVFSPTPLTPGQAINASIDADLLAGDLLLHSARLEFDEDAASINGKLSSGMILATCMLDGRAMPVQVLPSLDEVLIDVNGNGMINVGEPIGAFGPDGEGNFQIDLQFASPSLRLTMPKNAAFSCSFSSLFLAGEDGNWPVQYEAVSLDIDTAGEDDQSGTDPIVRTGIAGQLVIGQTDAPECGDADGSGANLNASARSARGTSGDITTSDALRVLRGAVGSADCDVCVCDVDSSDLVTATDALLVLKAAVGQPVTLDCPACGG